MATITKRTNKNGSVSYRVEVRIHTGKDVAARRSKTFSSHKEATAWAKRTEGALTLQSGAVEDMPVAELIRRYLARRAELKPPGRTIIKVLESMTKRQRFQASYQNVSVKWLLDFASERRGEGAGPSTFLIDFGALAGVFRDAKGLLGLVVDDAVFREARVMLVQLGLIAKPARRSRRPEGNELDRLLAAFRIREQHHSSLLPMADMTEFLVYSCMRLGEMTGLRWADVDSKRKTVMVRNRKHPTAKMGNDDEVALLGPAWEILQRQPRLSDRVFPFRSRSVSAAFQRTVAQLGIVDLRLHDLRRHGISRLLELGFSPSEVSMLSGHQDLSVFHRHYTKISVEHLHAKLDSVRKSENS
jgi:integrase